MNRKERRAAAANGRKARSLTGRKIEIVSGALHVEARNITKAPSRFVMLCYAKRNADLERLKDLTKEPRVGFDPMVHPDFAFQILNGDWEVGPGEVVSVVTSPINTDLSTFFFYSHPDCRGRFLIEILRQGTTDFIIKPGTV